MGRLRTVGIIEEQYPDRARLFMRWKQMDWPVLVDSLDVLGVSAVPMTLLIDEAGIVRAIQPKPGDLESFLAAEPVTASGHGAATKGPRSGNPNGLAPGTQGHSVTALQARADALTIWGKPTQLSQAIDIYQQVLRKVPDLGPTHFRLGVAFCKRYESSARHEGDFAAAVQNWRRALDIDPNQYIWRRRIQQFGPRLDKPYPFYDWVARARDAIRARGEVPPRLLVEPRGAEIARPSRTLPANDARDIDPDPHGEVTRDLRGLIRVEITQVASTDPADRAARIHVVFRPNTRLGAHWNREADNLMLWVDPPPGWRVDRRLHTAPTVLTDSSTEARRIEFEVRWKAGTAAGVVSIPAHALYDVCEDVDGTCVYRRQDLTIRATVPW